MGPTTIDRSLQVANERNRLAVAVAVGIDPVPAAAPREIGKPCQCLAVQEFQSFHGSVAHAWKIGLSDEVDQFRVIHAANLLVRMIRDGVGDWRGRLRQEMSVAVELRLWPRGLGVSRRVERLECALTDFRAAACTGHSLHRTTTSFCSS